MAYAGRGRILYREDTPDQFPLYQCFHQRNVVSPYRYLTRIHCMNDVTSLTTGQVCLLPLCFWVTLLLVHYSLIVSLIAGRWNGPIGRLSVVTRVLLLLGVFLRLCGFFVTSTVTSSTWVRGSFVSICPSAGCQPLLFLRLPCAARMPPHLKRGLLWWRHSILFFLARYALRCVHGDISSW